MKYIVVGLGSFGASLAAKLTEAGNEVIGIDTNMDRVDHYKEHISHTICMDATDEFTVAGLPLKDTDMVVVAIGEDKGASVMATALFKNLQVKRLISLPCLSVVRVTGELIKVRDRSSACKSEPARICELCTLLMVPVIGCSRNKPKLFLD